MISLSVYDVAGDLTRAIQVGSIYATDVRVGKSRLTQATICNNRNLMMFAEVLGIC